MKYKPIKVGFDLDGVLLYNPARIVRPLIALLKKKKMLIERKELEFFVPKPGFQQIIWDLFHKSSCFLAPGFSEISKLKNQGLIEPYLITGRFKHLENDFANWKRKMNADFLFVDCYINDQNEQPHLFKERMIKKLKLQIFVEDNWDIVGYLVKNCSNTDIYWITNLIDNRFSYSKKYFSFNKALKQIKRFSRQIKEQK